VSGAPITTKIASIKEAKTCSMLYLEVARVKASSTYILAGSRTFVPWSLRTPVLIKHGTALARSGAGSRGAQEIMSRFFLCFSVRSQQWA
jgi:hypothetical protein